MFKSELIGLWLSQGYLRNDRRQNMTPEEIGEENLKILISNSLLECVSTESGDVGYRTCELMYDLAANLCGSDLIKGAKDLGEIRNCRHLLMNSAENNVTSDLPPEMALTKLRTLSLKGTAIPWDVLIHARYLRTLMLDHTGITELPPAVALLKHLRFLDVSHNPLSTLPDSIGELYQLQTLIIHSCVGMVKLPKVVNKLVSLRHISTTVPMFAWKGLQQLTNLQRLPCLSLDGDADGWTIDELGDLHELRDEIRILGMECVKDKEESKKAGLAGKANVTKLNLSWVESEGRSDVTRGDCDEDVLEGLEPHPNITSIEIQNFNGAGFPTWITGMAVLTKGGSGDRTRLKNLTMVRLLNCNRCQTLPKLGQLPLLKSLILSGLYVEYIGIEFYGGDDLNMPETVSFQCLRELDVSGFRRLATWREPPKASFPRLETLRIRDCNLLESIPVLGINSLTSLELQNLNSVESLDIIKYSVGLTSLSMIMLPKIESLPQELADCWQLQTLHISGFHKLAAMPGLESLVNLKSKVVNLGYISTIAPIAALKESQQLTNLQSLPLLSLDVDDANDGCTINELEDLHSLSEKSPILGLECVKDEEIVGTSHECVKDKEVEGKSLEGVEDKELTGKSIEGMEDKELATKSLEGVEDKGLTGKSLEGVEDRELAGKSLEGEEDKELAGKTLEGVKDKELAGNSLEHVNNMELEGKSLEGVNDKEIEGRSLNDVKDEELVGKSLEGVEDNELAGRSLEGVNDKQLLGKRLEGVQDKEMAGESLECVKDKEIAGKNLEGVKDKELAGKSLDGVEDKDLAGKSLEGVEDKELVGKSLEGIEDKELVGKSLEGVEDKELVGTSSGNIQEFERELAGKHVEDVEDGMRAWDNDVTWWTRVSTDWTQGSGLQQLIDLEDLQNRVVEIEIFGLECVKDNEQARKVGLAGKANITSLNLVWREERCENREGVSDEDVLEALEPHPNITSLVVENFLGVKFPPWIMERVKWTRLENLTTVQLLDCSRCQTLPTLGHLPLLKRLFLSGFDVETIGVEFYGYYDPDVPEMLSSKSHSLFLNKLTTWWVPQVVSFRSLCELEISGFCRLTTWSEPPNAAFPCLVHLQIKDCRRLESVPALASKTLSLIQLENLDRARSLDIIKFNCGLTRVRLDGLPNIESLPEELANCRKLQKLQIYGCHKLVRMPSGLGSLSLTSLTVSDCEVINFLMDDILQLRKTLEDFVIYDCPGLKKIPSGLEECSLLKSLVISNCPINEGMPTNISKVLTTCEEWNDLNSSGYSNHMGSALCFTCLLTLF
ncbi:hypothetical protein RND81_01G218300 [Saponaria officinalis]